MWITIKDILVNVLFILFPMLFYFVFLREDSRVREKVISKFFFILLLSIVLMMILPAVYSEEFKYDLRIIPIILGFIYGGLMPGLCLTALMLGFTYVLYPAEFFIALGNYIIASVVLIILRKFYYTQSNKGKLLTLTVFYFVIASLRAVYFIANGYFNQIEITIYLSIITLFTLICVIALIEALNRQIMLQRELEHIEKMNAISQLAASVAHEIRNPMTTVRGFLQILSKSKEIPETDRSFITISISELDRAQTIINEYLSLSKPQKNALEIIDFTKLINDSIKIISTYAIINNVEISKSVKDSLKIKCFKHEIQQVLINIMKNGIEAMDNSGKMHVSAVKKDQWVEILIQDNGSGISNEQIKRLGTPYFSTKEKGTGLGLTVSFEIIKRMNGLIDVQSQIGQGTTFKIRLPAVQEKN
ncbi:ATP-binding protein [Pseudalkalibacillus salsuginis]|uniref:ATP-binding protein n=1 Tax=Pseudalkalibacillus salsuginis TaxID=2910972 RepID=UPI001F2AC12B|nr:ATP-binding protein [Pseudalkalibacillus salsuginis]MCF6410801.1 ATP-binding protein [Pseudalkalibacillus salsuginis]